MAVVHQETWSTFSLETPNLLVSHNQVGHTSLDQWNTDSPGVLWNLSYNTVSLLFSIIRQDWVLQQELGRFPEGSCGLRFVSEGAGCDPWTTRHWEDHYHGGDHPAGSQTRPEGEKPVIQHVYESVKCLYSSNQRCFFFLSFENQHPFPPAYQKSAYSALCLKKMYTFLNLFSYLGGKNRHANRAST